MIQNLTKLEYLQLFKQGNTLHAMTDVSINGLEFVLFQKDSARKTSIVQVGSTSLKNAQVRWHTSELELLEIQYCLKKYTSTPHIQTVQLRYSPNAVASKTSSSRT